MINTVTLNPAVDRILYLNRVQKNITNRTRSGVKTVGGKGTHVSMNLAILGIPSRAFGLAYGETGQYILRDRTDLVRIFIHADKDYCIEKLMGRYGISREEATQLREKTDAGRAAYHKHYTGTEWLDVRNYDLALDTSKLSQDECIRIVSEYIKSR